MHSKVVKKIGFGGGCHWCTEAVFQSLRGVLFVEQGYIASTEPNSSFSEAVIVSYDSLTVDIRTLIEIHIRTHSSTSRHRLRNKYRSAVYFFSESQWQSVNEALNEIQKEFEKEIITLVLPFVSFKESSEQFKNYYKQDPERPFCQLYIEPKLDRIKAEFSHLAGSDQAK